MPTSMSGFSSSNRTASGNHGEGTSTSIDVWIPSREQRINASLPEWEYPMSSPLTIKRGGSDDWAQEKTAADDRKEIANSRFMIIISVYCIQNTHSAPAGILNLPAKTNFSPFPTSMYLCRN